MTDPVITVHVNDNRTSPERVVQILTKCRLAAPSDTLQANTRTPLEAHSTANRNKKTTATEFCWISENVP